MASYNSGAIKGKAHRDTLQRDLCSVTAGLSELQRGNLMHLLIEAHLLMEYERTGTLESNFTTAVALTPGVSLSVTIS
jgi:hypothetical protein